MPRWTRKRGDLLREAGIGRRGFQESRYGVGGGLGVRCGCELFAKDGGSVLSVSRNRGVCFQETLGGSERKMGRGKVGFLRCLPGLFLIDQGTAGSRGALHEKSLFVRGLFLV